MARSRRALVRTGIAVDEGPGSPAIATPTPAATYSPEVRHTASGAAQPREARSTTRCDSGRAITLVSLGGRSHICHATTTTNAPFRGGRTGPSSRQPWPPWDSPNCYQHSSPAWTKLQDGQGTGSATFGPEVRRARATPSNETQRKPHEFVPSVVAGATEGEYQIFVLRMSAMVSPEASYTLTEFQ